MISSATELNLPEQAVPALLECFRPLRAQESSEGSTSRANISAAVPCRYTPSARTRSQSSVPNCAVSAASTPVSTSPEPPLAKPGPPVVLTHVRPSGAASDRVKSFKHYVRVPLAALSFAAVRAGPPESASLRRPSNLAISPGCGVTHKNFVFRLRNPVPSPAKAFNPSASSTTGNSVRATIVPNEFLRLLDGCQDRDRSRARSSLFQNFAKRSGSRLGSATRAVPDLVALSGSVMYSG